MGRRPPPNELQIFHCGRSNRFGAIHIWLPVGRTHVFSCSTSGRADISTNYEENRVMEKSSFPTQVIEAELIWFPV